MRIGFPPGPQGEKGEPGDPGVVVTAQDDGSLSLEPTGPGDAAVAMPAPPTEGTFQPVVVDGQFTWVQVEETP